MNSYWLASVIVLLTATGYVSYGLALHHETPNPVSMVTWTVLLTVNAVTYSQFTTLPVTVLTFVQTVGMLCMLGIMTAKIKRHGWAMIKLRTSVELIDWALVPVVVTSVAIFIFSGAATKANLFLQVGFAITFVPYIKQAWHKKETMNFRPWAIISTVYVLQFINAWHGDAAALIFPTVGFFGHFLVMLGVIFRRPT